MDQRWRDGSIKEATFTDPDGLLRVPDRRGRRARPVDHQRAGLRALPAYPGASSTTSHDDVTPSRDRSDARPSRDRPPGRRPADQPAPDRGPPRHRRLGQARLPGRHAGPDRRHHLLRHDPQRVRRALPGARGLRAGHPRRDRATSRRSARRDAEHGRRRRRQQVRHRPLAAAERAPGPADRRQHVHPELRPDPGLQRQRHQRPVQPGHRAELPRGAAHRRADQGRRVRRRLRLRRLLPRTATTWRADDGTCTGGVRPGRRSSPATTSRTWSCRRTRPTRAPATRRTTDGLQEHQRARTATSPAAADGCLYRVVREEDVNVDLGNQFTPGRSRRRRAPATTTSSTSRRWSRAATTSASPAPTRRCATSGWSSCRTARTPTPTST